MRTFITAMLCLTLDLIHPINMSFSDPPEDLDGSGYDLVGFGSGSGDWSEQGDGSSVRIKDPPSSNNVRITTAEAGSGTRNIFLDLTLHIPPWPADDIGSAYGVVGRHKNFFENKEIVAGMEGRRRLWDKLYMRGPIMKGAAGVVAGGVTGVVLAAALAAILIYKEQRKDDGGYIPAGGF